MSISQWAILAALTAGAAMLAGGLLRPEPQARAQPAGPIPAAGAPDRIVAVSGQLSRDSYGLYLLDLDNRTLCVYEYFSGNRKLRLVAARTFRFDLKLDSYNTEPTPKEISKLVAEARRIEQTEP
jgi:hypothetical protein